MKETIFLQYLLLCSYVPLATDMINFGQSYTFESFYIRILPRIYDSLHS